MNFGTPDLEFEDEQQHTDEKKDIRTVKADGEIVLG